VSICGVKQKEYRGQSSTLPIIKMKEGTKMQDEKNILAQPNKFKWRENPPKVTPGEMRSAMASARGADKFSCDCWNTKCPNFGDCRKCLVHEMCLKQLPTCQRDLLEELQQHYNASRGDK
jgi:hypothetical protein